MKKSVLALALGALFVSTGAMAADDNAITDGSVNFTGKVIAPACTLVAATKDSSVTLPDVSATKLQTSGQESGVKTDVPIELKDCDVTVTKNAAFTFSAAQDNNITTAFAIRRQQVRPQTSRCRCICLTVQIKSRRIQKLLKMVLS